MNPNIENYKIFLEVFKGYLDTALTANIWFYTLTGAVVSYYLSNRNEEKSYLKFSLFLPFVLGVQIIVLSILGIGQARFIESTLKDVSNIQLEYIPAVEILVNFLKASIGLISLVCIGLILLFMFLEDFPGRKWIMEQIKNKWGRGILVTLIIAAYYILIYVCVLR
jgi:chromate transport protein ChrA